jgi:alkylation response protein AidB-like acyl-CoA dehydrogenase
VPLDRLTASVDASAWKPLGMDASNSYRIAFDGIRLAPDDLIGQPGDYERNPWFHGGALRFAAVHVGIVERLASDVLAYVRARGRADDPMQQARIGEIRIAVQTARNWLQSGLDAWLAYDEDRTPAAAARVIDHVDMARLGIERAALDVLERTIRGVGAHGMLESLPFAQRFRDLHMYLRQPAPDATLLRVGVRGLAESNSH